MRKFISKTAFTIAEMIVVLIIIGIVMAISIHSIRQRQQAQYQKLYVAAYNALKAATYEANTNFQPVRTCTSMASFTGFLGTRECWNFYTNDRYIVPGTSQTYEEWDGRNNTSIPGYPRQFPGFLFGDENIGSLNGAGTDAVFCRKLTDHINILSSSSACRSFLYARSSGVDWSVGDDFDKVFCASTYNTDTKKYECDKDGGKINPSFIAANGQQFYISPIVFANPPFYSSSDDGTNQKKRIPFRLIAVDLNGAGGPNTQLQNGNRLPDIVLFAITAQGEVIPLGLPEFNLSYLEAKVVYPRCMPGTPVNEDGYCGEEKVINKTAFSESMTMFDAKMVAWYGELHSDEWLNSYYGQVFMPEQHFSYANLFYYWGINCHGTGCNGKSGMGNIYYADALLANIVFQFIYANDNVGLKAEDYAFHTIVPLVREGGTLETKLGCEYGKAAVKCPSEPDKRARNYCCIRTD